MVALYRWQNFAVRILHPLLEKVEGVNPHSIFFKHNPTNLFSRPTPRELELFAQKIREIKPEIVGISLLAPFVAVAEDLTKIVRENSDALIVWGGVHPTIEPDSCIKTADVVCVGEGEGAFVELVQHVREGTDYSHVNNLWVKKDGQIIKNGMRPLIENLDELPFPAYDKESYSFIESDSLVQKDPALYESLLMIQASRGCPFVCTFCATAVLRPMYSAVGTYVRRRSPENFIREITETIKQSGNVKTYIEFIDEVFGSNPNWLKDFCERYTKEVAMPFSVEFNPKLVAPNPSIIGELVKVGLDQVQIGIESADDHIRNDIFKRPGKNAELISLAKAIDKYKVQVRYDLIVDNPYDTEESMVNTIKFLMQLPKPLSFNLFALKYFPGYPLTERAIKDGYVAQKDVNFESLIESVGKEWHYVPKLFSWKRMNMLQNVVWLMVSNLAGNKEAERAIHDNSIRSNFWLYVLNAKSIVLGRIVGVGGLLEEYKLLMYINKGFKYLLKGDFNRIFTKLIKVLGLSKISLKHSVENI